MRLLLLLTAGLMIILLSVSCIYPYPVYGPGYYYGPGYGYRYDGHHGYHDRDLRRGD